MIKSREIERENVIAVLTRNLIARQKSLGISRTELAKNANLSQREIFKLLHGQVNPRVTTLVSIAQALNVTIDNLLTDGYDQKLS